jgi:hypothetical protein
LKACWDAYEERSEAYAMMACGPPEAQDDALGDWRNAEHDMSQGHAEFEQIVAEHGLDGDSVARSLQEEQEAAECSNGESP